MKILAIIQARIGSTRLPKKVLLDLAGRTVLERVIERVKACSQIDELVVATTTEEKDLEIVQLCNSLGISVFRGSEEDVLDRFYQAAKQFGANHVVRITADCPLIDPLVIEKVVMFHLREKKDYTSNTLRETFPDGQDVEIMSFAALRKSWRGAKLMSEREHVTPFIKKNPKLFKLGNVTSKKDLSKKRWTIDNKEDYEFTSRVYAALIDNGDIFGMQEIISFLMANPVLEKLNKHLKRNEGYAKSLREDREIVHG